MCALLRREFIADTTKGGQQEEQQQHQEEVLTPILVFQGGASLIGPGVILTGAHKVIDFVDSPETLVVRCGEWDTQTEGEPLTHQERQVTKVVVHPEYKAPIVNTVALLLLESDFILADHIDTICLPQPGEVFDSRECFVKGWGKDVFGAEGEYQVVMKKVEVPMVERGLCQDQLRKTRLGRKFKLDSSLTCAGGEEGKDACRGDGGGPLVCQRQGETGTYYQVGIIAGGIGCGEKDVPGLYADVAKQVCFIDWALNCHLDSYVLRYGEECNGWLDEKVPISRRKKIPRREILSLKSSCPEPEWPKKVVPEPYIKQEEETKQKKTTLPGKIKTKTKNIKDNQAFPKEGGY